MPKTTAVQGTILPASWFNAVNSPLFDDIDEDGHNPRLTDGALSNAAGSLKPQWYAFRDALAVTAGSGLTINIGGGVLTAESGLPVTIAPTSRSLGANSVSFVWVSSAGLIDTGAAPPVRSYLLARVTTTAAAIANNGIEDLRGRGYSITARSSAIAAFGGGGYEGDLTISSNTTLTGFRYVRNLVIQAGVTVTVPSGVLRIFASGNVTIAGTINVSPPVAGGAGFVGGPVAQHYPAEAGRGFGASGGHGTAPAPVYSSAVSIVGSGGASGFCAVSSAAVGLTSARGGNGGGAIIVQAAGTINVSGGIYCQGGAAGNSSSIAGSSTIFRGGAGGGSGGLIRLQSLVGITITPAGILSVRGGNGSAGATDNTALTAAGGGGGGGGIIELQCPSISSAGSTLDVAGGLGAVTPGSPSLSGSVGGSFGGLGGTPQVNGAVGQVIVQAFAPTEAI